MVTGGFMSETYCFNADPTEGNFTVLNNTCIRDKRLSLKAKGLHTYFMSLPPGWKLYKRELVKHSRDGMDSVNSALKELIDFGYVELKKQQRSEDGKFSGNAYGFHAKPIKNDADDNRTGFSVTVKPSTDKPCMENPVLLNTNKLNIDLKKTEQTNLSDSRAEDCKVKEDYGQEVSESVFVTIIKGLFETEYPFDKNFERSVFQHLSDVGIEKTYIEAYMNYVYERTKLGNVKKSFEGLFRKLALSSSIARDFKNSSYMKKSEKAKRIERKIKYVDCPICSTRFDEIEGYCPTCSTSVLEIKNQKKSSFIAKKRYYEMTDSEKQKYDIAYSEWEERIKTQHGRPFLTENEKVQFWKEYGLID